MNELIWFWLLPINIISGLLFAYDKHAAHKHRRRIPEMVLHATELAGGVFINLILMYLIRHKNMKISYFLLSWLIAIIWLILFYLGIQHQII